MKEQIASKTGGKIYIFLVNEFFSVPAVNHPDLKGVK